jgi:hypothetical protein
MDHEAFRVRTLVEIEHLGAMIETLMAHPDDFQLTATDMAQHRAALSVLYWVRNNPDCEDMIKKFEDQLKAFGYNPPAPIKPN